MAHNWQNTHPQQPWSPHDQYASNPAWQQYAYQRLLNTPPSYPGMTPDTSQWPLQSYQAPSYTSNNPALQQIQNQSQQRQAQAAAAAASIALAFNTRPTPSHDATATQNPIPRQMVAYGDVAEPSSATPQGGAFCCNRWYRTEAAKAQHEKQHMTCPECSFVGVKVVLNEHLETVHGKGPQKPRKPDGVVPPNAPKINTPEELAAWIAERKRNWPTQANIERKKREAALAQQQHPKEAKVGKRKANTKTPPENKQSRTEAKTSILGTIGEYESDSNDDSDDASSSDSSSGDSEESDQDSDDLDTSSASDDAEDDDEAPEVMSSKDKSSMGKLALPESKEAPRRLCRFFARGKCTFGSQCRYVHEKPDRKVLKPHEHTPLSKRPNLLRMLLGKEIKEEQSIILQCFRYMVDNGLCGNEASQTS